MKKTLLIAFLSLAFVAAYGQRTPVTLKNGGKTTAPMLRGQHPGGQQLQPAVPPAVGFRVFEQEIGTTNFDIQTLASLGRRIGEPGNGTIGATWQMAFEPQPGFADRGTGYNQYDGSSWGPNPTDQVESSRSGYPSYTVTEDGTEVIISHKALPAGWQLIAYTKAFGETTWSEHILPSNVPNGNVWAKIAAGGPDGNTLHVLGISLNPSFGGVVYNGMVNHPLYWRSTDGGETWDKQDVILPGVDSSLYLSVGSENYTIEANGETVAIAILPLFGDILVLKSENNGDSWEKKTVYDFPLDKWNGEPFTAADLPADPNAPDSLYTYSTDGSGSLVIDDNGIVHLFFAELYATGNPVDTGIYLNLGTNGIAYWNDATEMLTTITGAADWDGDGVITLAGDIGQYRYNNSGLASFPVATIDADGNIYLIYMAFHEEFVSSDDQTYRHIFIVKSEDGGETWSAPYDLVNEDITEVPEFVEAAYPSIPPRTGDAIQIIYQQDYVPGLTPANTDVPDQYIMHVALDKATFGVFSAAVETTIRPEVVALSPNPAGEVVNVDFELMQPASVQLELLNLLGEKMQLKRIGNLPQGQHRVSFELEGVPAGMYVLKFEAGDKVESHKLVVR
ncbi:MAG: T9SS type A sorting domain-containing protein [Bacteroidetes bacterium]|nr:T9SS type A sorting domain-containing protein [Bacteroidota bacterium]